MDFGARVSELAKRVKKFRSSVTLQLKVGLPTRVSDGSMGGDADRGAPVRSAARSSSPPPIARSVQSVSCGGAPSGESAAAGGPRSSMRPRSRLRNWLRWSPSWRSGRQRLYSDYLVAKRANSLYESGRRSGAWVTDRVGTGYSEKLLAPTRNCKSSDAPPCPFVNLPEKTKGRWGLGITPAVMKRCHWVKPVLVAQVKFTEWTHDNQLRQPVFLGLRTDKEAKDVARK
jgi:hypothetical protein